MILMALILSFSVMFIFLTHPLSMGITLLIQTILIAIISGLFNINFLFSYILFLIMVGGMLVLFIYMTSIASNEKFMFSNFLFSFMIYMIILMLPTYLLMDNMFINMTNFSENFNLNYMYSMNLNKFFNYPSNIILFMMIIYLFITLIAVVKITDIKFGPLRQKF
uniref:NADH dehydrogenase subunit 6 n=1 Tax=Dinothenarus chrysocomus TaxID=2977781 RepID=UPI0021CC695D|nr:NADH dehydrogenase subunit 6 [Dinothenarus chrysocomus]UWM92622.1 NADH dehydrogenase subunit 6 [Dinothenarus chrysocomus]